MDELLSQYYYPEKITSDYFINKERRDFTI
jgi:hypothetical protein